VPLLPARDTLFPTTLLSDPPAADRPWWVLHAKPRTEKGLADRLRRDGVAFFLPQYAKTLTGGGRVRRSYLPLFPGYVFLAGSPDDRGKALATKHVAQCLPVPDQLTFHRQLAQVYRVMARDLGGCAPAEDPRIGALVEITDGPFAGMTGRVTEVGDGYRFTIEVEFIGRGVSVTVEHWMFRRLTPQSASVATGTNG
jgi:transcription termination/antitermination protein NusG